MAWARETREMGHRVRKKGERGLGQGERERPMREGRDFSLKKIVFLFSLCFKTDLKPF
jgi:hypothetical protein